VLLLLVCAGAAATAFMPYKGFREDVYLDFARGTSTRSMANQLAQAGVVQYPWQFLAARLLHPSAKLQAGEYKFSAADSPAGVASRIARGDIYYYEVTIPEGSNIFDVAKIIDGQGTIKEQDFLTATREVALIRDLDPQAESLEGYLFPSTYRLTRHTSAAQFAKQMTDQFRREWKAAGGNGNAHQATVLASLVEKETGVADERPIVASVYNNRLRIGMKLDCDPTTIYAAMLYHRYNGVIHQSDLASESPYNTYRHTGLPPGPIANPGRASLKAALAPAETDYFYFVAKPGGAGSHNFAASYSAHERNVAEYRNGKAAR
jgi:UPF0755 protein